MRGVTWILGAINWTVVTVITLISYYSGITPTIESIVFQVHIAFPNTGTSRLARYVRTLGRDDLFALVTQPGELRYSTRRGAQKHISDHKPQTQLK